MPSLIVTRDPSNRLATIHRHRQDRQTGQTNNGLIGQTVLPRVAQNIGDHMITELSPFAISG